MNKIRIIYFFIIILFLFLGGDARLLVVCSFSY